MYPKSLSESGQGPCPVVIRWFLDKQAFAFAMRSSKQTLLLHREVGVKVEFSGSKAQAEGFNQSPNIVVGVQENVWQRRNTSLIYGWSR